MKTVLLVILLAASLSSCEARSKSTDREQAEATESLVAEANRQVGMPNIVNFTERKFAKVIRELCDTEVSTYTYIVNMMGERKFLCESIGFGIPYSVQFTNPMKVTRSGYSGSLHYLTVPQAEANGLYMPDSSSATWVLEATENGITPIYVESEIIVSTHRLEE